MQGGRDEKKEKRASLGEEREKEDRHTYERKRETQAREKAGQRGKKAWQHGRRFGDVGQAWEEGLARSGMGREGLVVWVIARGKR